MICYNCDFEMKSEPIIDTIYSQITMQIESEEVCGIEYTCPLCGRVEQVPNQDDEPDYDLKDFYDNE